MFGCTDGPAIHIMGFVDKVALAVGTGLVIRLAVVLRVNTWTR